MSCQVSFEVAGLQFRSVTKCVTTVVQLKWTLRLYLFIVHAGIFFVSADLNLPFGKSIFSARCLTSKTSPDQISLRVPFTM